MISTKQFKNVPLQIHTITGIKSDGQIVDKYLTSVSRASDKDGKTVLVTTLSVDMVHDMWDFYHYIYAVVEDTKTNQKYLVETNVTFEKGSKVFKNQI